MPTGADPRKRLPSGAVTLLFADIEGSTRLLVALRERYQAVRARARELVRAVAARHRGHEVDWAGDGVFLAFARARDAVAAAAELQRALAAEPWAPDEAIRLRIGIHTGEPHLDEEGYVGLDVVLAARICAAAHGGQVVLSRTTRDLLAGAGLADLSLRPLGDHRLKDLPDPQPLFQLVGPGLAEDFPPLSTLGGANLPALHYRLVGRDEQVAEIERLLAAPQIRLVTITGPGGAGKSRLALEVASRLATARPVRLVGLASVSDPGLVPAAIARTLGARESADRPLVASIAAALAGTGTLLYLDNLEHLGGAAEHVRQLLEAVPDLDVLATSRAPLRLSAERVLALAPLSLESAVELFFELAAARGVHLPESALPAVAGICRKLDCLPLALELAAARLTFHSASQLLRALGDGLGLDLEGPVDLPERQRTLRAAIDWSYGLLSESQRALHGALAVFAGGCTLEDARAVAGDRAGFLADLEALVLGSLVQGEAAAGQVRLSLLETVREHALERFGASGRLEELRERHAEHFLGLALVAEEGLAGPEQAAWAERLERELDNLRAALDWLAANGRAADALRATAALERFWRAQAHLTEARGRIERYLASAQPADVPEDVRALALRSAAHMAMGQSDWSEAARQLEEALALFRACGRGYDEVVCLCYLSFVALRRGDAAQAESTAGQALELARTLGDERTLAFALMALGDVGWVQGEHERSLARYEEAVELSRRTDDPLLVVDAVYNFGMAAFQVGARGRGRAAFEEALALASELREAPHAAAAQFMLAELDALAGDAAGAGARARESLRLYTELEDARSRARCLVILAVAAEAAGAPEDAARLLGAAAEARAGDPPDAFERPLLEPLRARLERALTGAGLAGLESEGARLQDVPVTALVTAGTGG
ncbi:MAG TPA: adenylate/guanylate cyclase domain-containing protein [Gaiellaceae bacterium]|nr:adenylate/guanylate cyclase domain-containing protein [Gaiellaceae bacterium]